MFEIFIALFGGAYCIAKICGDRSHVRKANEHAVQVYDRIKARQNKMAAVATDRALEADIDARMVMRSHAEEGFARFGVNVKCLPTKELRYLYSDLLLAQAGKIRWSYVTTAHRNILGLGYPKYTYEAAAVGVAQRARRDAWIGCLLAIESELIRNGVDPCFIFAPTTGYEGGYQWAPASPIRLRDIRGDQRYSLGQIWALCATRYDDNLRQMS